MSFQIRINGTPFGQWKSAVVQRSIDSNAGAFRFSTSSEAPIKAYPVKTGDFVEIIINGMRKIAGFVDEISGSQSDNSHNIEVVGRDNTADLIDSSVPDGAKVTEGPVTLEALAKNVISALSAQIRVDSTVAGITPFTSEDLQAAGSGQSCMDFLVSFARKRQVYLVPDGAGGLLIYRPVEANVATSPLLHRADDDQNNVLNYSFRIGQQQRYRTYICRSQDNMGADPFAEYFGEGCNREGRCADTQIRISRLLEVQAEETMGNSDAGERAKEESNIRRAASTTYTATVAGAAQANGTLWDFGQFVDVIDDYAGIKGRFLIKSVEYAVDTESGTRTQLVCVPPDAYQVTAEAPKADKRSSKSGEAYQNETPPEQGVLR